MDDSLFLLRAICSPSSCSAYFAAGHARLSTVVRSQPILSAPLSEGRVAKVSAYGRSVGDEWSVVSTASCVEPNGVFVCAHCSYMNVYILNR